MFLLKLISGWYLPEYGSDFEYEQIIENICIKIKVKYNGALWCLSFYHSAFCNAPSRFTVVCIHYWPISPTSVILLQTLTCTGLIPSPGWWTAPAEVSCVQKRLLALVGTSAVRSRLCQQHLLSGFLFLNKPNLNVFLEQKSNLMTKISVLFCKQILFKKRFCLCC